MVSTHMPLARHDDAGFRKQFYLYWFLLTCLLRGMTKHRRVYKRPCAVSTHMPLARHDGERFPHCYALKFLLTCLLRGMTPALLGNGYLYRVSTHMPLARHDRTAPPQFSRYSLFLLTCLLRGMTGSSPKTVFDEWFLLTCLLRGMTSTAFLLNDCHEVSTHMPLARHDRHHQ